MFELLTLAIYLLNLLNEFNKIHKIMYYSYIDKLNDCCLKTALKNIRQINLGFLAIF